MSIPRAPMSLGLGFRILCCGLWALTLLGRFVSVTTAQATTPVGPVHVAGPIGSTIAVSLRVGWAGLYRPGEWSLLLVTLDVPGLTPAQPGTIEVRAYQDSRSTVVSSAPVTLQPGRTTWSVPAVLGSIRDGTGVVVRDERGRVVASLPLGKLPEAEVTDLTSNTRLVGVSGPVARTGLAGQAIGAPGDFVSGFVPLPFLPEWPELYGSLDALVLTGTDLSDLTEGQSNALTAWVRSGGTLVVCVPDEGIAPLSRLTAILPARPGPLSSANSGDLGSLPLRPLAPAPGARRISLVPNTANADGAVWTVGLGSVRLVPFALSIKTRPLVSAAIEPLPPRVLLDYPPAPDPQPHPWWWPAGWILAAVGLLLGPIEAIVRRGQDLWPWRWWTVAGTGLLLVGTLTVSVGALGEAGKDSDRDKRITLSDQASDRELGRVSWGPPGTAQSSDGAGWPTFVAPVNVPGNEHVAAQARLKDGQHHIVDAANGWRVAVSRMDSAVTQIGVSRFDRSTRTVTLRPGVGLSSAGGTAAGGRETGASTSSSDEVRGSPGDEWILETAEGVFRGERRGDAVAFGESIGRTVPREYGTARRLTPQRSVRLQRSVEAGQASLLWLRRGDQFTRVFLSHEAVSGNTERQGR